MSRFSSKTTSMFINNDLLLISNYCLLSLSGSVKNKFLIDHRSFIRFWKHLLGLLTCILNVSKNLTGFISSILLSLKNLLAGGRLQLKVIDEIPVDYTSFLHVDLLLNVAHLWIYQFLCFTYSGFKPSNGRFSFLLFLSKSFLFLSLDFIFKLSNHSFFLAKFFNDFNLHL